MVKSSMSPSASRRRKEANEPAQRDCGHRRTTNNHEILISRLRVLEVVLLLTRSRTANPTSKVTHYSITALDGADLAAEAAQYESGEALR
jgi:hypothetical protein